MAHANNLHGDRLKEGVSNGEKTGNLENDGAAPTQHERRMAAGTRTNRGNWLARETQTCPECGSAHLSSDPVRGELFCESCGFVIEENLIDRGPEWSAYDRDDQNRLSRVGPPMKRGTLNSHLNTVIVSGPVDSKGTPMSPKAVRMFYHLSRVQRQVSRSGRGERSAGAVSKALGRLASQLQLPPSVVEEASYISMRAIKADLLRGRSIQALASASLYIACRNLQVPRTLNEITSVARISRKRLTKTVGVVSRKLGTRPKPVDAGDYVARFCSELSLGEDVRVLAGNLLSKTGEEGSLSPPGTAASAIYLAALAQGKRIPQKRVAQVAGVSEVTLRSHFRLFKDLISVEVPRGRAAVSQPERLRALLSPRQAM